jgi:hypothetical protein
MNAADIPLNPRPRPRSSPLAEAFGVVAGPAAWLVQLCCGVWLANQPCFPSSGRLLAPPPSLSWTWGALVVLVGACAVIALVAFLLSLRRYRAMPAELGREHFMALWGMLFGGGFCIATLFTIVAFATLPRCAG